MHYYWKYDESKYKTRTGTESIVFVFGQPPDPKRVVGDEVRTRHPVALCSVVRIMHSVELGDFAPLRRLLSEKMVRNFDMGRGRGWKSGVPIARMAPITNPIPT